jgi:hypothetical protein
LVLGAAVPHGEVGSWIHGLWMANGEERLV